MFDGTRVLITGGSSGIGKVLAERFLGRGAHVTLVARDGARLDAAVEELRHACKPGRSVERLSCDVGDPDRVREAFAALAAEDRAPEVLINSAGVLVEGYFHDIDAREYRRVMDINFFGTLHCIQAALPHMERRGSGRIVNIGSVAGLMGVFGYAPYCASKHALTGLSETLRLELRPRNIRVHLVCPPEFDSPMVDELERDRTPENRAVAHMIPPISIDAVADDIVTGVASGAYLIVPGRRARATVRLQQMFPRIGRQLVDRRIAAVYRGPRDG